MKLFLFPILIVTLLACRKNEDFSTDPGAILQISTDTVFFDTVFTQKASITQRIKIFNRNPKAIRIDEVRLMGGESSAYQINLNGQSGNLFRNIQVPAHDSINLFVRVTIDPNEKLLPFIVADSVSLLTNGNLQKLQLQAFGQNVRVLRDAIIGEDAIWNDQIPYLVYGTAEVMPGKTLRIQKGSRIYFHKGAKILVRGSLRIEGNVKDSVVLSADRLERIYADEPGQWEGIQFSETSINNLINYATIQNAVRGIRVDSSLLSETPRLILANSTVKNMEIVGIMGYHTHISCFNSIISNCGKHLLYLSGGGLYNFKQNTFANLNYYFSRATPSVYFSDALERGKSAALGLTLINNIIWGSLADELIVQKTGEQFNQVIRSNLIKSQDRNLEAWGNLVNQDPLFLNARTNNFRVLDNSPAVNRGEDLSNDPYFTPWLSQDKSENKRLFPSELGCYENK